MEWEGKVKQGLFPEEVFSGEMRRAVMEAADRRANGFFRSWKPLAGAIVLSILVAILMINRPFDSSRQAATGLADETKLPVAFTPLQARTWELGQVIADADPDILPGLSNKYNPLKNKTNGYIAQIPFSDIQLIDEKRIDGFGTALHYTLKPDSVTPHEMKGNPDYFGFTADGSSQPGTLYHYGTGHMYGLKFGMTRLFGQEALRIEQPTCRTDGETCVWYLKKDEGGQVSSYMDLDAASYEYDLDGDGKEEAVVVTHKQNNIYIFKEKAGQLFWASVREALGAKQDDSIQYDAAKGIFALHVHAAEGGTAVSEFHYEQGADALVRIDR